MGPPSKRLYQFIRQSGRLFEGISQFKQPVFQLFHIRIWLSAVSGNPCRRRIIHRHQLACFQNICGVFTELQNLLRVGAVVNAG